MEIRLFEVDGRNITWQLANQIARVRVDSLRSDIVQYHAFKESDRIGKTEMPGLADYEQLLAKIRVFERRVLSDTRRVYLNQLSNPHAKVYGVQDAASDPKNPKVIAVAELNFPEYSRPFFKVGLFGWIRIAWLRAWYRVLDFIWPAPSLTGVANEYLEAAEKHGLLENTEEFTARFKTTEYTPESIPLYPKPLAYYLNVFGVRANNHGQNLGRKLFKFVVQRLNEVSEKPPLLKDAPAKMLWQSAESAQKFYEKLGATGRPAVYTKWNIEHRAFFLDLNRTS